jgi:uncharacterized protein (UPF0276 family)
MSNFTSLPELGVGLVYMAGLRPFIESNAGAIDFLEVEPQQHWFHATDPCSRLRLDVRTFDSILSLAPRHLVHSVGCPVAAVETGLDEQRSALAESIRALDPPWISEHLSFDRFNEGARKSHAGFLLPPIQSDESIAVAARNLRRLKEVAGRATLFETGVNYLRPWPGELPDGQFFAAVAEAADCGILLDLHNLFTNERNGRQPMRDVVDSLPLDRVVEVHIAGGEWLNGYWLDAHSQLAPSELWERASDIVRALPNLKAITFEIMDEALVGEGIAESALREELERLRILWQSRASRAPAVTPPPRPATRAGTWSLPALAEWQTALGALANDAPHPSTLTSVLARDPGVAILKTLVRAVRMGTLVDALQLSSRLLRLTLGPDRLQRVLEDYARTHSPLPYATDEVRRFGGWLRMQGLEVSVLEDVLGLEEACCRAIADGRRETARFSHDPDAVVAALLAGKVPHEPRLASPITLEISP